jgi:hypothetical protein
MMIFTLHVSADIVLLHIVITWKYWMYHTNNSKYLTKYAILFQMWNCGTYHHRNSY